MNKLLRNKLLKNLNLDSHCGTVGWEDASDTRYPLFESSHQQFYLLSTALKKMKIKKKGTGNGAFVKIAFVVAGKKSLLILWFSFYITIAEIDTFNLFVR